MPSLTTYFKGQRQQGYAVPFRLLTWLHCDEALLTCHVEGFLDSTKVRTCSVSNPWLIRFLVVTLHRTVELSLRTVIARIEFVTALLTELQLSRIEFVTAQQLEGEKVCPLPTNPRTYKMNFPGSPKTFLSFLYRASDQGKRNPDHIWEQHVITHLQILTR